MPERNRVTPMGEIVAIPLRGAWTGNRGILHEGHRIVRSHASDLWITCALEFRGRWREQWLPRRYTHLYFHDEAVSFAAGHRPCAECRRGDYRAYQQAWIAGAAADTAAGSAAVGPAAAVPAAAGSAATGSPAVGSPAANGVITARSGPAAGLPGARQLNAALHAERIVPGTHRRRLHEFSWDGLPDGTFVLADDGPALVLGDATVPWTHQGYGHRRQRPRTGTATVITPPSAVRVLRAGYPVQIDESARPR